MPDRSLLVARMARFVRYLFAIGAFLHLVLVCLQPFLAGWSLDGSGDALDLHGLNGTIIITVSMILIPLSVLWWRPGGGSFLAPILTIVHFAAESFQLGMGYADILVIHVPLGVGIVLGAFVLVWLSLNPKYRIGGHDNKQAGAI